MRYLFIFIIIFPSLLLGQGNNDLHIKMNNEGDSLSFKSHFLNAVWSVQSRTFFMSTINEGTLKDDYTLASGAGIGVLTDPFHGFQLGLNGYFTFEIFSSDIDQPDSTTNAPNRYEIGLYDLTTPGNTKNLDRLEELYLKYTYSKSSILFGRFNINTPFMNPQDGRMRFTLEEGAWLSVRQSDKIGFNGGWIWSVSPRSTMNWYSTGKSIGLYSSGVTPEGTKSNYNGNIASEGIAIANIYYKPFKNWRINFWNGFVENVMNTAMIEVYTERKDSKRKIDIYHGLIFLHQNAINQGGNADQEKTYISKGAQSNVISLQVGFKNKRFNSNFNYTHITGDGRYLMPREWGRESFYTFLPRERNEGFGNIHAIMSKTTYTSLKSNFKTSLGYGYYKLPDIKTIA
ncbi:MAG: outer membrane porin, OprD family [Bacteroidetes bacterium]|nr:outer membrane porin, OprD family [Bacteroidota bacterium]